MTAHPIEAVFVNGVAVDKGAVRAALKKYIYDFETAASFRLYELGVSTPKAMIDNALWFYDAADLTTPDNGTTCIHDADGNRYKKVTLSVAGKTLFTQTAIAGTADALAVTSDGMATLSATPQYIIITPSAAITGPATIAFDGAAAIDLLSNVGAALAADELLARPTLLSVTSTDARIITPW